MNIVLFDRDEIDSKAKDLVTIDGRRASHIHGVLKLSSGSSIRVGEIGGRIGTAEIVAVAENEASFKIQKLDLSPPEPSRVELILALPRPKSLKRTLRAIANLGIKSVHLIHSIRVDKSYWSAPALEPSVLRQSLIDGLEIARDTILPQVHIHRLFKPFAQDVAPHLVEIAAFVAHPTREANSKPTELHVKGATAGRIQIAIGPEGGFSDYEVGLLNEAGFKNLSLGDRIYSVECAVPVIESLIRFNLNS